MLKLLETAGPVAPIRSRELEGAGVVVRAACAAMAAGSVDFELRRAQAELGALSAAIRRPLSRLLVAAEDGSARADAAAALSGYGALLERHGLFAAAADTYERARDLLPDSAEAALHAARCRRLAGDRDAAHALYAEARRRTTCAQLRRFTELGEALLCEDAVSAVSGVIDAAEADAEHEVFAVALEERARLHRERRDSAAAISDYLAALDLYDEDADRVRVACTLADLLLARGDVCGAREALLIAFDAAPATHRAHVIQRLRTVARAERDELGLRRWPAEGPTTLVSMMPVRRSADVSAAERLRRWRDERATAST